jgi:biopolymer transport protein ExbB/TolQ
MAERSSGGSRRAYVGTLAMLVLALAFPIGLMLFNPTLMFERGWEQYVGTAIYFWAALMLARELRTLWTNERAFDEAPALLRGWLKPAPGDTQARTTISEDETRVLPARLRQLRASISGSATPSVSELVELNREASSLDQEQTAGRFTLTRYILYLLPIIGFIGTVEGISKALMNISRVLPMVRDLDGFLNNLTSVTSALQIAFDSTLLALFLSAALMLAQTLVYRRAEDLLARIDRWVVEHVLPKVEHETPQAAAIAEALGPYLERLHQLLAVTAGETARSIQNLGERLGDGLGPHVGRFADAVDRLPPAFTNFHHGAELIGQIGDDLASLADANEAVRRGAASLGRIETAMTANAGPDLQLEAIQRGVERTCTGIETLSTSISHSFERSSRATQEQLARTLNSLKDALDLLHVSMEQGNALYRSIVKKMFDGGGSSGQDNVRAA